MHRHLPDPLRAPAGLEVVPASLSHRRENMDSPDQRVKIAIAESERLRKYLAALPPHAWTKHSACDGWDVRDVVEHLAGGAEFYRDMLSRGL